MREKALPCSCTWHAASFMCHFLPFLVIMCYVYYVVVVLKISTSFSTGGVTALSLFGIIFARSRTVRRLSFSTN